MKLDKLDLGIGIGNRICIGEKLKSGMFRSSPRDITQEVKKCLVILAFEEECAPYTMEYVDRKTDRKFKIEVSVSEIEA